MLRMVDATHDSVGHVPPAVPKVALYVSGTPSVQATPGDWARFPSSGHVRIEQGYGPIDYLHCDVLDIEARAITPAEAAQGVHTRITQGIHWTTMYGSDGALLQVEDALNAAGPHGWWAGHVDCWLADWNLSEADATSLLGTHIHGMTCRAVQWASPTSNPLTLVPWSGLTLAQANVDLSVTEDAWHQHQAPAPPPPPHPDALATARQIMGDVNALSEQVKTLVSQLGG
jgi:hypothetical protein